MLRQGQRLRVVGAGEESVPALAFELYEELLDGREWACRFELTGHGLERFMGMSPEWATDLLAQILEMLQCQLTLVMHGDGVGRFRQQSLPGDGPRSYIDENELTL